MLKYYLIDIPNLEKVRAALVGNLDKLPILSVETSDSGMFVSGNLFKYLIPLEEVYFKPNYKYPKIIYKIKSFLIYGTGPVNGGINVKVIRYSKDRKTEHSLKWDDFLSKPWGSCYYRGKEHSLENI